MAESPELSSATSLNICQNSKFRRHPKKYKSPQPLLRSTSRPSTSLFAPLDVDGRAFDDAIIIPPMIRSACNVSVDRDGLQKACGRHFIVTACPDVGAEAGQRLGTSIY
ncbi:hypothetical protein B0H17DRAFT_1145705 [Mycena rosella]|uniref:Uncharacterized protein n=1 Tax=Mycena rosella TaxID=1033263 RepID=A0AAD7CQE5_MYCRO|nr:hypothetical protein B0H17DRAFT_1145705 [Mycena rosella]